MRRILFRVVLLGACLAAPLEARAQMESREAIDLQNQILEMRRDMQQLQQQQSTQGSGMSAPVPTDGAPAPAANAASGDLVPQLLERVQTLEDQVRTLRGEVDEVKNQSTRSQQDLAKQLSDLQFQLQNGGAAGAAGAPSANAAPAAGGDNGVGNAPTQQLSPQPRNLGAPAAQPQPQPHAQATPARKSVDQLIHEANAALQQRDYRGAEAAAQQLQQLNKHTYDAQFIIAQAKAGQRNYKDAAIAYDDTYNHNHHGQWAQDGLLGVAVSLYNLGDSKAACGALNRLKNEFPSQRSDIKQNGANLRRRANCSA